MIFNYNGKRFLNLTPHDINVHHEGTVHTFPKSGWTIRLTESHSAIDMDIGLPVFFKNFGDPVVIDSEKKEHSVEDLLPYLTPGTFVLTSSFTVRPILDLVVKHKLEGVEVLVPDSGPKNVVRNEAGQIIGVKSFVLKRPLVDDE